MTRRLETAAFLGLSLAGAMVVMSAVIQTVKFVAVSDRVAAVLSGQPDSFTVFGPLNRRQNVITNSMGRRVSDATGQNSASACIQSTRQMCPSIFLRRRILEQMGGTG